MAPRFAAAGLGRRPARSFVGARAVAAIPDPPATVLAGLMLHSYDANVSCAAGQWNDLTLSDHLIQGTGGNQPSIVSAGALSYAQFDGISDRQVDTTVSNYGGDCTLFCVAEYLATTAGATLFAGTTSSGVRIGFTSGAVGGFTATVVDATGTDVITGPAGNTNRHLFILRNATGVARKFYVDGGAGVSGARTQALVSTTRIAIGAGGAAGDAAFANCRIYYAGICNTSPSIAQINSLGAWAAYRYGITWSTAS